MNERSAIEPHRRDERRRLALWLALVTFFIVVQYAGRSAGGGGTDPLYKWSFAAGSLIQEAIFLLIVLAIAGFGVERLGLRLPKLKWRSVGLVVGGFFAVQIFEFVYIALVHPGNEQGLTPNRWQPSHAAEYVVNGAIVCTLVPFVEEITFRGLGFYLLRPYGKWVAILGTGVLFGLSHGLLLSLPIIVVFGCVLAWIRERTDSVIPGMFLHGTFNLIALVAAVTVHR
ncbi:MAG: family intrarane metalloprotease [Actinomycetia bacterium]|nr:family intrarane metalloprotease [Actinomycetes bacterium]